MTRSFRIAVIVLAFSIMALGAFLETEYPQWRVFEVEATD